MSTGHWHITPVNGYDISALEAWLAKNASCGKKFSFTIAPFTYFEPIEPVQLQIHLEPIRGKVEEDPELSDLFASAGWQYWGTFRSNYHVFATEDLEAQAHTDPELLEETLKKFFRQKLLSGFGLAVLSWFLLAFYYGSTTFFSLRYYPMQSLLMSSWVLPFALSVIGLLLVDLSYLFGLVHLLRYRRAVRHERHLPSSGKNQGGYLLLAGLLVLLPVTLNTLSLFWGMDYSPYPLEGSGFVTLQEIEGEDFVLTGDYMHNMDYISHEDTLLSCESWYFNQYGMFPDRKDTPALIVQANRFRFPFLAQALVDEIEEKGAYFARLGYYWHGEGNEFQSLPLPEGLDYAALYRMNEGRMYLLARRGGTVLRVQYRGTHDLTDYLDRFAQLLEML